MLYGRQATRLKLISWRELGKHFKSKSKGMEHLHYHERLKELGLHSIEGERYVVIYVGQKIEGIHDMYSVKKSSQ